MEPLQDVSLGLLCLVSLAAIVYLWCRTARRGPPPDGCDGCPW